MKKLMFLLAASFLAFSVVLASCKDDDEIQVPEASFYIEDCEGNLYYDEEIKEWAITPEENVLDREFGFEEFPKLIVKNVPEEYKSYEGRVLFSGTVTYLHSEVSELLTCYVYSLELSKLNKR